MRCGCIAMLMGVVVLSHAPFASASEVDVVLRQEDALRMVPPGDVRIGGFVGERLAANLNGILMHKDEDALLDPFRKRVDGGHPWIGEHVGKWLSAASMMWAYQKPEPMAAKLRRVAHGLIDTQLETGYLGTYGEKERWKRWDVWVHKYNMLGLLDYHAATGDPRALDACRNMADMIIDRFGPGKASIIKAGTHGGMASTSILEPFARLYLRTGEERYLVFARYLVEQIDSDNGPKIVTTLMAGKGVNEVANAKAYEMMSNLIGLLVMYRIEGTPVLLTAAERAFEDIVENRCYITGGCTYGEFFKEKGYLPNGGHVSEMCVMMSQMQLARELMLITGDASYGYPTEKLIFNHLLAGQLPSGEMIAYYTALWGRKFYFDFLGCCISSGPRAIAVIPSLYYLVGKDTVLVDLLGESELETTLDSGTRVRVVQETPYPFGDAVKLTAQTLAGGSYTLRIRIPETAEEPAMHVDGRTARADLTPGRTVDLKVGEKPVVVEVDLHHRWELVKGLGMNEGLFALRHGPVFFALDREDNRHLPNAERARFDADLKRLSPQLEKGGVSWRARVRGYVQDASGEWLARELVLVPFMDAGRTDQDFSVWLRDRTWHPERRFSMWSFGHEKQSRPGEPSGSIVDNNPATFTTTRDGTRRDEDWFQVSGGWHSRVNVIEFHHGKTFEDGGWFDTSEGKPRVVFFEYGRYYDVGTLDSYPDTTATDPGSLEPGQAFRCVIPIKDEYRPFGVRVVGKPAHGNNPKQNFASCGDIQVFYDPDLDKSRRPNLAE